MPVRRLSHGLTGLLCLSPFRATITLGKIPLLLVGETEMTDSLAIVGQDARDRADSGPPSRAEPAIELAQGGFFRPDRHRWTFRRRAPSCSERTDRREYGRSIGQAPLWSFTAPREKWRCPTDQKQESLTASDVVVIDTTGGLKRTAIDAPPSWATETEPSAHEVQIRDQFIRMFHPGRPVLTEIVAASEDDSADIKQLSIRALKSLGDVSLLMPMLSRKGDPDHAQERALDAIRSYMGLGPDAANRVRDQLAEEFGDDTALFVEKMLVGYPAEEASSPQIYERLVAALGPEQQSGRRPRAGSRHAQAPDRSG